MDDRTKQFRVGVVVFATAIITALLIVLTSDFSWAPFKKQYQLKILVDQAPGVAPETPVRRRGILIGRVAEVDDTDNGALITVNIDQHKQVKSNENARVQTSLIGDAVLEFMPVRPSMGAQPVPPGSTVEGMYNPSPMDLIANLQGDLKQTIISLGRAGDEVGNLAAKMNTAFGDQDAERMNRLLTSTELAMTRFAKSMGDVDDVLGDDEFRQDFKEGLAQLPSMVADAKAVMEGLERAVGSADQNLVNLQGFTNPFGERGPEIVDALEAGAENFSELLGESALLVKSINSSEGTVGMLLHDRQLYDQIASTVGLVRRLVSNIEVMSRRLRPILDDVRVFTDKIARDPGRIARGVINRETPIK